MNLFTILLVIGTAIWLLLVSIVFSGCYTLGPDGRIGNVFDTKWMKSEMQWSDKVYGNGNEKLK